MLDGGNPDHRITVLKAGFAAAKPKKRLGEIFRNILGQSYMDTLILTILLVSGWEYLRSPAFRIGHLLQGIWQIFRNILHGLAGIDWLILSEDP